MRSFRVELKNLHYIKPKQCFSPFGSRLFWRSYSGKQPSNNLVSNIDCWQIWEIGFKIVSILKGTIELNFRFSFSTDINSRGCFENLQFCPLTCEKNRKCRVRVGFSGNREGYLGHHRLGFWVTDDRRIEFFRMLKGEIAKF